MLGFLATLALLAVCSGTPTPNGVLINLATNPPSAVELAVEGTAAFRVSVNFDANRTAGAIPSPFISPKTQHAAFTITRVGSFIGIRTTYGSVQLNPTTGAFVMADATGANITTSASLVHYTNSLQAKESSAPGDTCADPRRSFDAVGGTRTSRYPNGLPQATQAICCNACNNDPECTFWVWANEDEHGGDARMCWLLKSVRSRASRNGRTSGGSVIVASDAVVFTLSKSAGNDARFYGTGGSEGTVSTLSQQRSSDPLVDNTRFFTPYYWTTDGYSALGVSAQEFSSSGDNHYPARWWANANDITWQIAGSRGDVYLMPAKTAYAGVEVNWRLTGGAQVLPRYAYGFLACRWGWKDDQYILETLKQFRTGEYPIDAWISDFEWYTPEPDYELPLAGSPTFRDWDYNPVTFPSPVAQLRQYHSAPLNMRFGGIRKPRLGNSQNLVDARAKGWVIPNSRDLNYTIPAVREYYAKNNAHFLDDGVDFWWNDEGESYYFLFHYWNLAQVDTLRANARFSNRRFFSISRSYTPGMQRLGAAVWTGDVPVSWDALRKTPGYLLNWGLSGVSHVTVDIGGFSGGEDPPELLTRWYQAGVFMSIMRVHSDLSVLPHFPFLYPQPYANAMREALNLRYALLPTVYSLAHNAFTNYQPMFRPLFFEWPADAQVRDITSQWLLGSHIMVAPIMNEGGSRDVYLPDGLFYELGSTSGIRGPQTLQLRNAPITRIPVYCRAGAIVLVAPRIQFTDQLPGGALGVQIYAGANGSFDLVEDDGETNGYTSGNAAAVRRTRFEWNDMTHRLTWTTTGSYRGPQNFERLQATLFSQGRAVSSPPLSITSGFFQF